MKQVLKKALIGSLLAFTVSPAYAGNLNLGIHVASPPVPSYEPLVVTTAPPRMVYADGVGCDHAVVIPQDMYYLQNSYYLFRDGRWHRSRSSRGPWLTVSSCDVPRNLVSRRIGESRDYRRSWEGCYLGDRDWRNGSRTVIAGRNENWRYGGRDWQQPEYYQGREWNRR